MHAPRTANAGFKRQVVFRISSEEWPLLEAAAREYGSIQAAVLAGLHALPHPVRATQDVATLTGEAAREREADHGPSRSRAAASPAAGFAPAHARRARTSGPAPVTGKAARRPSALPTVVEEEISARQAAALLGLKPSTVRGYIRSGRLHGRYDSEPTFDGWMTTRAAVEAYAQGKSIRQPHGR